MVGSHTWDTSCYCPKLMKSKVAKLMPTRCVQLSSPKDGSKGCLLSVTAVLHPAVTEVSTLREFLSLHSVHHWLSTHLGGFAGTSSSPSDFPPAPWFGISARSALPRAELAGSSGLSWYHCSRAWSRGHRPKGQPGIVSGSLWHPQRAPVAMGMKPASVKAWSPWWVPREGLGGIITGKFLLLMLKQLSEINTMLFREKNIQCTKTFSVPIFSFLSA